MSAGLFGAEPLSPAARRALIAGCIGFAVDFFDIYLPILALAPVTTYFQPPGLSSTVTTTIYFFIFATTLLGRPCGAVIFGHWADRIGRRRTTIVSIVGFGVCTLLIACLPGYASVGITSLLLLILLRFTVAFSWAASTRRTIRSHWRWSQKRGAASWAGSCRVLIRSAFSSSRW